MQLKLRHTWRNWKFDRGFKAISRFQNLRAWTVLISRNSSVWLAETAKRQISLNKDASLYFFRWFASISMESVQTTCLEMDTSECSERNPDFGLFWTIWDISWPKWVVDLETKGGRLKKSTILKTWGPRSSSIVDRDRGNVHVVGSRDGETRGVLATIILVLTHWLLTNVCHRHIASIVGLQPRRFRDRGVNPIIVTEGYKEALGNRVQLRAAVCGLLTQQAQIPANVVLCWRAPTFWVPVIVLPIPAPNLGEGIPLHGSTPLTWNKISEISHWQKCFCELKISNPRISCTLNGVRRSSWMVVWVIKWSYASETNVRWQIFCSCSWRAVNTCKQEKSNINLWLDTFYLWANSSGIVFWYFNTLPCILLWRASCVNKSSIFWCLFQRRSLVLSPTTPFKNFSSLHSMCMKFSNLTFPFD